MGCRHVAVGWGGGQGQQRAPSVHQLRILHPIPVPRREERHLDYVGQGGLGTWPWVQKRRPQIPGGNSCCHPGRSPSWVPSLLLHTLPSFCPPCGTAGGTGSDLDPGCWLSLFLHVAEVELGPPLVLCAPHLWSQVAVTVIK